MTARSQYSLFGVREPGPSSAGRAGATDPELGDGREPDDPGRADPDRADPGATAETAIPVSHVNAAVRRLLEESFPPLWVAGEIANWSRASSGHCYFSLRDDEAQISCVMWRSDAARLPTDPEEGMEVCAFGELSLYEVRGSYQLVVRTLEARGEGLWRLAYERLRAKLAEEGLLDDERKKPLPRIPARVGIVTSRTGAALRDVVSVIRRRAPWTHVLVSDCRVQGEGAAPEIVRALERLVTHGTVDLVILTRGGGSVEDLWAFNEEPVARAVADCPLPTLSAVGHEVDVTITDLVADARAPTPSAAGEVAVPDVRSLRSEVRALAAGLVAGLRRRTRRGRERAERAAERVRSIMERRLERLRARLGSLGGRLDALSPVGTMSRGYAVPMSEDGRLLRGVEAFEPLERFRLRVVDGRVRCRVDGTERVERRDPADGRQAETRRGR